ncbi:MAG: Hpt domain-containing protein [Brevundimonas sp.]|nr:MAG: Hpt domain-containing protein [Brevundimonas sp.]
MARRDLSGAVDFTTLERMTGDDAAVSEEVLALFVQQAEMWSALMEPKGDGWRDAVHTIRGAASGIGANALAAACAEAEVAEPSLRPAHRDHVQDALNLALADVAAYRHELMLRSLRG